MERKSQTTPGSTLHMADPVRLTMIRRAFGRRGLLGLSLVAMVRIVFDEWLRSENGKPKK
jgi:hypothetical protein